MTSSYYVVGRLFVERYASEGDPDEFGETEVLDTEGVTNSPFGEAQMELQDCVFDADDVPPEPGTYCVMYAAELIYHQDSYTDEWDVEADIKWSGITRLTDDEARFAVKGLEEELRPKRDIQDILFNPLKDHNQL